MTYVQELILTLMEITALIFILDTLLQEGRDLKKYCFIILSSAILTMFLDMLNIQIMNYLSYIYVIGIIAALFKKRVWEAIMEFGISLGSIMIIQIVIMTLINISAIKVELFYQGLIINSFLIVICIIINRFLPLGTIYNNNKHYIKKVVLFIINIMFYIILAKFFWESNREIFNENIVFIAGISIGFVAFNILFLVNNVKYQKQKKVLETYNRYSSITANLIDDIKKRQHEFKNHINTIYGIAQVTDEKLIKGKIIGYIQEINGNMRDTDNIIQVEDEITAAIIYNKICEAKDKNICFNYEINNNVNLKASHYELSEILNNLLDNAFEAALKNQEAERRVELKIYRDEDNKIIEVKNTIAEEEVNLISKFFNKGFSTKKEQGHGYGLYNVKKIVEANKGKIQLTLEENFIKISLLFR